MANQAASGPDTKEAPKEVYAANAMEEYMKKQAAKKEPAAVGSKPL